MKAIWRPYEGHIKAIWRLYEDHMETIWKPYEAPHRHHMEAIQRTYGHNLEAIWRPYGGHTETIQRPYGGHSVVGSLRLKTCLCACDDSSAHHLIYSLLGAKHSGGEEQKYSQNLEDNDIIIQKLIMSANFYMACLKSEFLSPVNMKHKVLQKIVDEY